LGEALGANVGVEYSRRGTRGQLVGGTVEVQLARSRAIRAKLVSVPSVPDCPEVVTQITQPKFPANHLLDGSNAIDNRGKIWLFQSEEAAG
jgi:hypothetical protein